MLFGTTTDPGSESNTLPISSIFGALNAEEKLSFHCNSSFGDQLTPAVPVSALELLLASVKGKFKKTLFFEKFAFEMTLLKRKPV